MLRVRSLLPCKFQPQSRFLGGSRALSHGSFRQRLLVAQFRLCSRTFSSLGRPIITAEQAVLPANFHLTDDGLYIDRSLPVSFNKILIANRGEIACRVIRTCKQLGIQTVAVYSDADARSQHVQMADEAYRIGEPPAAKSYLLGDLILDIAKKSGAQAIHPGYGFLSENAEFSRKCAKSGVIFIGPPASAIDSMGSKSASKKIMTDAGVPVVPGYHGDDQSVELLKKEAAKIKYPVMIKAVSGGGGKGMRICFNAEDFEETLEACKREAKASFGDDRVLVEKYVVRPRHIEFQVFADTHGDAVHFYERDCSVQRRHQKVLEEAPAPFMTPELRAKMGKSAVGAAKAVGYVGAGTVEFIFDADTDEYYFMEMNTRLQVEHPVSEMIVRRDFVQLQFHVAAGHHLPVKQSHITGYGHAIEARVYAENPYNNFLPCTGKLSFMRTPDNSPDTRVESGVRQGDEVSIFYDPMIAKLICWGPDREAARKNLNAKLQQYQIVGPPTNLMFLQTALNHPVFASGKLTTQFIPTNKAELMHAGQKDALSEVEQHHHASLALLYLLQRQNQSQISQQQASKDPHSPWGQITNMRINSNNGRKVSLSQLSYAEDGAIHEEPISSVLCAHSSEKATIKFGNHSYEIQGRLHPRDDHLLNATVGDRAYAATVAQVGDEVHVFVNGHQSKFKLPVLKFDNSGDIGSGCLSPMAGKIVKVNVKSGQQVKKGAAVVIMEAMKMEHVIRAPHDGVIDKVFCEEGGFVEGGKVVVTFASS